ncbi:MAG: HNH endonuclease [Chryseotalea sp. WA131a]|nr:MAG: HNH endonuclease [Chryseotalea sp. WA131a]
MTQKEFVVLPDLDKKIDEAIHDAINYFDKKCPYCDSLLFTGHIRNKIQIDHFIPVSKGGQHVPWNILPVCQKCNSKKLAKKPQLFLTHEKVKSCESYLANVKSRYVGQLQSDIEKFQQIKAIFNKYSDPDLIVLHKSDILKSIYEITTDLNYPNSYQKTISGFEPETNLKDLLNSLFKIPNNNDLIEKYSATELLQKIQPLVNFQLTRTLVSKTLKKMGFFNRTERIRGYGIKRAFYLTPRGTNNGT